MKFDIYNRFHIEILRQHDAWIACRTEHGMRVPVDDLVIPPDLEPHELATYLDDIYHELAGFGDVIACIADNLDERKDKKFV